MLPVLAAALVVIGCGSSRLARSGGAVAVDDDLYRLSPTLTVLPLEAGQWGFEFTLASDASSLAMARAAAERITAVSFVVYAGGGARFDSLSRRWVTIDSSAPPPGGSLVVAYTAAKWVPVGLPRGDEYVIMSVWTDRGVYVRTGSLFGQTLAIDDSTLVLRMRAEPDAGGLRFVLDARRTAPMRAGEYRTSREPHVLRIVDADGETVWSSATSPGAVFVGPVLPDAVGTTFTHEVRFDGIDRRTGSRLKAGRYTLVGEVPAWPRSYTIQQELVWGE
jgi:hypothetical protein